VVPFGPQDLTDFKWGFSDSEADSLIATQILASTSTVTVYMQFPATGSSFAPSLQKFVFTAN
jgi:hypothetical protein